jgi:predicted deacylase
MRSFFSRRIVAVIIIIAVLGVGLTLFIIWRNNASKPVPLVPVITNNLSYSHSIIGLSVQGRAIEAYTFGNGVTRLAFVGGIHGGYEWNSVLLAYQFIDYLKANPGDIPQNMAVTVIPSANPDGIYKVVGKEGPFTVADVPTGVSEALGRVNADNVDLNRNFDCKWQATSTWQNKPESAGTAAFSEPETQAIRNFVLKDKPSAVIFWHSQSNAVYASQCKAGILPQTLDIMNAYSLASGYPAIKVFAAYATTGAADDWLASINIPAITVELKTHATVEWDRNLAGIKALFTYFGSKK